MYLQKQELRIAEVLNNRRIERFGELPILAAISPLNSRGFFLSGSRAPPSRSPRDLHRASYRHFRRARGRAINREILRRRFCESWGKLSYSRIPGENYRKNNSEGAVYQRPVVLANFSPGTAQVCKNMEKFRNPAGICKQIDEGPRRCVYSSRIESNLRLCRTSGVNSSS